MIVEHTVVIDLPIDEVWEVFTDAGLFREWQEELVDYEQVSGEFLELGAVADLTFRRSSGDTTLSETIAEREEGSLLTASYTGLPVQFSIENHFDAIDDDTTEWTATAEVKLGLMHKPFSGMIKSGVTELAETRAKSFKQYVENL
ncbi:MAG TPA: SRPBCC family protein [Solirubrobacterales bacterium]|nr:SRPBCC family protein [Solirubrobacterales bacterium]